MNAKADQEVGEARLTAKRIIGEGGRRRIRCYVTAENKNRRIKQRKDTGSERSSTAEVRFEATRPNKWWILKERRWRLKAMEAEPKQNTTASMRGRSLDAIPVRPGTARSDASLRENLENNKVMSRRERKNWTPPTNALSRSWRRSLSRQEARRTTAGSG